RCAPSRPAPAALSPLSPGAGRRCSSLAAADGLLACAGFENASDAWALTIVESTAEVDATRAFRGSSSGPFVLPGGKAGTREIGETHFYGLPAASMYAMRAFVYLPAVP